MTMLFLRHFLGFTGGHLKLFDYIAHTAASGWISPLLYMTPASDGVTDADNIFRRLESLRVPEPTGNDAYFLAGEDWFILDAAGIDPGSRPVINLVQGLRHADPQSQLFACLSRPALRLCVSHAVAEAIRPFANGPVCVMPTAVAVPCVPALPGPAADIFIGGQKAPALARAVAANLADRLCVDMACDPLPREMFLARAAAAHVAIMLPLAREGFFLPPLEAMSYGVPVITTDCLGSRDYCRDGVNCLVTPREPVAVAAAACRLIQDPPFRQRLAAAGLATAGARSLAAERIAYLNLLRGYLFDEPAS